MPVSNGLYYSFSERGLQRYPPVVLIHCAGGSHLSWSMEMRRQNNLQVIAVDLPGHGRSEGIALQSIEGYVQKLFDFLESLKIHRALLVGHSMGGAIALSAAAKQPGMVAGLGLISTAAFLGTETGILEHLSTHFGFSRAIQLIQEKSFGSQTDPALVKRVMEPLAKTRPGVLFSDWAACAQFDLRNELEMIQVPAWVAVGAEDRITPPACSYFLADRLPDAVLQVVPNAGHMVPQENGKELVLGLRALLERLDYRNQIHLYHDEYTQSEWTDPESSGSIGVL